MSVTYTLPEGFEYVGAAFVSTVLLLLGQNVVVGRHRKRAGIPYPQLYAETAQAAESKDAHLFNCAQRAHQNTLENIPILYVGTLVTATKFPILAASLLGIWSISRVSYTRGYITGDPKKRTTNVYLSGSLSAFTLVGLSVYLSSQTLFRGISTFF